MKHPDDLERKLGFDQIRLWIADLCQSHVARKMVGHIGMLTRANELRKMLTQVDEAVAMIRSGDFIFPRSVDAVEFIDRLTIQGAYLEIEELFEVWRALQSCLEIGRSLEKTDAEVPELIKMAHQAHFEITIVKKLSAVFDDHGNIKDDASPDLKKIRKEIVASERRLSEVINRVYKEASKAGYISNDLNVTIRDGRYVIPVTAEAKRRVPGYIHDSSSTGQTVFIEPTAALEANNTIAELRHDERREVVRILKDLSSLIHGDIQGVKSAFTFLLHIDIISAKARFGDDIQAIAPTIRDDTTIQIVEGRHPLLLRTFKSGERHVVPLNLFLDTNQRIILISGPNAGGKSVSLKTVGLLQMMVQSGIPVPVGPKSVFGIFENIYIDIGDEQSIEQDLSTYSSHLRNMAGILANGNSRSLVLLDEFGAGTDPHFGGAISEAILRSLLNKGIYGVITTHYSNLKELAQKEAGVVNAAMVYNVEKLEPTYMLDIGKPGSSFALEVASKTGIPKEIIDKARSLVGTAGVDFENLLNKVAQEKIELEDKLKELKSKEAQLSSQLAKYEQLTDGIRDKKLEIIEKARAEAQELLSRTNREIEKTIRHIRENQAHKAETKKARRSLIDYKTTLGKSASVKPRERSGKKVKEESGPDENKVANIKKNVEIGDRVLISGSNVEGNVIEIKGKQLKVAIGDLKTFVKKEELTLLSPATSGTKTGKKRTARSGLKGNLDLAGIKSQFSHRLDLRGFRAEEAIGELENYLDDALLVGQDEVRILHGKGDGVLRSVVRDILSQKAYIAKFFDEDIELGGSGITVVQLN